jgi:ribosomal protein S18 acetylase RimI-like enzyme
VTLTERDPGLLPAYAPDATRERLLTRIDTYYDWAPRATARVEEHGSLVLFVAEQGWPFYARPRLGRNTEPTTDEIHLVLSRQIELGVPRALEWIQETTPSLAKAARAAGMTVHECPLLMLGSLAGPEPVNGTVRLMDADEGELGNVNAAIDVAFGMPGTAVGEAGVVQRDDALNSPDAAQRLGFTVDALRSGRTVCAGAFVDGAGAVGGGSHNPRGAISEIVGVGLLPAFRRRGLAGAIAHRLARHALESGMTTVFCGAESSEVARVYERVGFYRIGTSCVAEMD